jgi:hypothetical protein
MSYKEYIKPFITGAIMGLIGYLLGIYGNSLILIIYGTSLFIWFNYRGIKNKDDIEDFADDYAFITFSFILILLLYYFLTRKLQMRDEKALEICITIWLIIQVIEVSLTYDRPKKKINK